MKRNLKVWVVIGCGVVASYLLLTGSPSQQALKAEIVSLSKLQELNQTIKHLQDEIKLNEMQLHEKQCEADRLVRHDMHLAKQADEAARLLRQKNAQISKQLQLLVGQRVSMGESNAAQLPALNAQIQQTQQQIDFNKGRILELREKQNRLSTVQHENDIFDSRQAGDQADVLEEQNKKLQQQLDELTRQRDLLLKR